MRRLLSVTILLSLLCSCASVEAQPSQTAQPAQPTATLSAAGAAQAVVDYLGYSDLTALEGEDLDFWLGEVYGLEAGTYLEGAVYAVTSGVDAREIAVLRLASEEEANGVKEALETYRQSRYSSFVGYEPAQAAIAEEGVVDRWDDYVALLICEDPTAALKAFDAYLCGRELEPIETGMSLIVDVTTAPDGTEEVTPVGKVSPVYTPTPTPTSTPTPTPTATQAPTAAQDQRVPFDPPNEFDMTLYDTSAILTAYATGEDSALGEKDRAILEQCRQVLSTCLTDGMTDVEKELALHDWLMDWGEYDTTVYDRRTPRGRADNTNPYGMLVGGYGICLGYATTFQLLMDLAGVECITVVGAAADSTEDHAWNMVKLEGEWYCVDPTWDDNSHDTSVKSRHRYFNVTSDHMAQTDHQWDYENTPEATATRFRWDGTGPLPQ